MELDHTHTHTHTPKKKCPAAPLRPCFTMSCLSQQTMLCTRKWEVLDVGAPHGFGQEDPGGFFGSLGRHSPSPRHQGGPSTLGRVFAPHDSPCAYGIVQKHYIITMYINSQYRSSICHRSSTYKHLPTYIKWLEHHTWSWPCMDLSWYIGAAQSVTV